MKTFSTLRNLISHGISAPAPRRTIGNNRNVNSSRGDYEREKCEEELYRLRYEVENLLENAGVNDLQGLKRILNDPNRPFGRSCRFRSIRWP